MVVVLELVDADDNKEDDDACENVDVRVLDTDIVNDETVAELADDKLVSVGVAVELVQKVGDVAPLVRPLDEVEAPERRVDVFATFVEEEGVGLVPELLLVADVETLPRELVIVPSVLAYVPTVGVICTNETLLEDV
ncbi:hypothetical protein HDU83_008853 [Entophlyctis luteolus]|nr:hypothetical protein HDU83_008853 [Entophlyctis luteolus]